MAVGVVNSELNDAFIRLIKLLDTPQDIPILSPLIIKKFLSFIDEPARRSS